MIFVPGALRPVVLALAAVEGWARIGASPLAWLGGRRTGAAAREGARFLLGGATAGTALLGLALTGLFRPAGILPLLALLVLAAPRGRRTRWFLPPLRRAWAAA